MKNSANHTGTASFVSALAASLAGTVEADAAVVYSGMQSLTASVTGTATNSSTFSNNALVDLDANGVNDFDGRAVIIPGSARSARAEVMGLNGNQLAFDNGFARIFGDGDLIDGAAFGSAGSTGLLGMQSGIAGSSFTASQGPLRTGDTGLVGLQFDIGGQTHFGWARIRLDELMATSDPQVTSTLTVVDWAYESVPGTAIAAGSVPEPSSIALLALGSVGLATLRNRRKPEVA